MAADGKLQGVTGEPRAPSPKREYATGSAIHLVRNSQIQGLQLSQMADQKASILMGATFVVFSIAVSRSLAGDLPVSLALLAIFAFCSSMCAVLTVLPSTKKPDPRKIPANSLFFGHYTLMDEDEWVAGMLEQLENDETVFKTMLHDIYQNGLVLQRKKYRFLAIAYRIFIAGLLLTLIAFLVELALAYI